MNILTRVIPEYLCDKYNLLKMVVFTAIYAIIFINVYQPFGLGNLINNYPPFYYLLYSSIVVAIGFVVIGLSRVVMYFWHQRQAIIYIQYWVWILVEVLFMSIFFTLIVLAVNPQAHAIATFKEAFFNTILILVIPYLLCFMFFSWVEKSRQLEERDEILPVDSAAKMIDFYDERNIFRLSVLKNNLLYLEAADNYVCIYYLKKNNVTRYMLRNTLKNMESYLADVDIARCHRSYMVNLEYVSVIRRQRGGIYLELNDVEAPDIPLSPRYRDKVDAWFKAGNQNRHDN